MLQIINQYSVFGFSGSRQYTNVQILSDTAAAVPDSSRVLVGCAKGVDAFFRKTFPYAEVFSVSSGQWGVGRGAFAGRSAAMVRALAARSGLLVSFPASQCPVGLLPSASASRAFCGAGSGTWATLSFALGSGVPCLVFLGCVPVPAGWGLVSVGGDWWCPAPAPVQLALF